MSKIIKNTTGSNVDIVFTGDTVPASSQITVDPSNYRLYAAAIVNDSTFQTLISGGTLVVNDGLRDLSAADGARFLEYPDFAFNIRFLNPPERANGFTSRNVQEAIEESKTIGAGLPYNFGFGFDGNASTGRWLESLTNVASNYSTYVMPSATTSMVLSFCARVASTITVTLYKNDVTILGTISLSGTRTSYTSVIPISLAAGNTVSAKVTSGSCERPVIMVKLF